VENAPSYRVAPSQRKKAGIIGVAHARGKRHIGRHRGRNLSFCINSRGVSDVCRKSRFITDILDFIGVEVAGRPFAGLPNSRSPHIFRRSSRRSIIFAATGTLTSRSACRTRAPCFSPSNPFRESPDKLNAFRRKRLFILKFS